MSGASTTNPTVTVMFGESPHDERETRWIHVEQVEQEDESATLEQAAELIDALYGVNLCDDQGNEAGDMGAGGNAAPSDMPDRNAYLDMAKSRLASLCDESGYWTAEVDVMRSHRESGYSLESDSCRIGEAVIMRREVVEDVEMSAASYDLDWPYDGELRVSGAAGDADVVGVRGSTVYFQERVGGRVRFRYRTLYDRVTVHVPMRRAQNDAQRAEPAAVVAFWENLAASCDLIQPSADNDVDARERERLCDPEHKYRLSGECWEEHERYNTCLCSGREAGTPVVEVVDVPCPDGTAPGSYLGKIRTRGGAARCEEEADELADPDYYQEKCCEAMPADALPACAETREPYWGGAEIENGPEYWKKQYGRNTKIVAVAPEGDGPCGELVRHWRVEDKICGSYGYCRGVYPVVIVQETVVAPAMPFKIQAHFGMPPYSWESDAPHADNDWAKWNGELTFFGVPAHSSWTVTVKDACGNESTGRIVTPDVWECWMTYARDFPRGRIDGGRVVKLGDKYYGFIYVSANQIRDSPTIYKWQTEYKVKKTENGEEREYTKLVDGFLTHDEDGELITSHIAWAVSSRFDAVYKIRTEANIKSSHYWHLFYSSDDCDSDCQKQMLIQHYIDEHEQNVSSWGADDFKLCASGAEREEETLMLRAERIAEASRKGAAPIWGGPEGAYSDGLGAPVPLSESNGYFAGTGSKGNTKWAFVFTYDIQCSRTEMYVRLCYPENPYWKP